PLALRPYPAATCADRSNPEFSPLSLHDALPISRADKGDPLPRSRSSAGSPIDKEVMLCTTGFETCSSTPGLAEAQTRTHAPSPRDRKSTRLNSSHVKISYAVFCLKKKKNIRAGP